MAGRILNPPWLMWGNAEQIAFVAATGTEGIEVPVPNQLLRIDYGRPETWRFLFVATILGAKLESEIAHLTVDFDLVPGLGRAQSKLTSFETFTFDLADLRPGVQKWSTSVIGPLRKADDDPALNIVELLTFQSLTVGARVTFQDVSTNDSIAIELAAYFSPNVHTRPEWHDGRFPGGEQSTL